MDDHTFDERSALDWMESVEKSNLRDSDIYPKIRNWLDRSSSSEIVDIGCGQGICSAKIELAGRHYTGVDSSAFLIDRARQLYGEKNRCFVLGNAYQLPLRYGTFDTAFSVSVWHLLSDLGKAAAELSRVLKANGHFLIITANPDAYSVWKALYTDSKLDGRRFEGTMQPNGKPASRDVLYLHTLPELLDSLEAVRLEIERTETFRPSQKSDDLKCYISVEGRKKPYRASTTVETARLRLEKLEREYLNVIAELYADYDVMKYIHGKARSLKEAEEWLTTRMEAWEKNGFGMYAFLDKNTGEFIGRGGLASLPDGRGVEIAYAFKKSHWGKGLATEVARKLVDIGFDELGLAELYATAWPDNLPSQRILEKIGMTRMGLMPYRDLNVIYYRCPKITSKHLPDKGMTVGNLCAAALQYSDNTAANLLLLSQGGPQGLTGYARSLGDHVTHLDRVEPFLNTPASGKDLDTTTPEATAATLRRLLLGTALSTRSCEQLKTWLLGNTTGGARLKAGLPQSWRVADKTGTGDDGAVNDIGILYPPKGSPIVIAAYLSGSKASITKLEAALAEIGRIITAQFGSEHSKHR